MTAANEDIVRVMLAVADGLTIVRKK